jgi:hypothetical protein
MCNKQNQTNISKFRGLAGKILAALQAGEELESIRRSLYRKGQSEYAIREGIASLRKKGLVE